jgi:hypothetical protein
MDERVEKLEAAVAALESAVARHEDRLRALEPRGAALSETPPQEVAAVESPLATAAHEGPLAVLIGTPALIGRSLLILAGAFLLRALTEAGTLATGVGVGLGLIYAVAWIVAAAMAASRGSRASAGFYAICAALIADPLLFEASTGFGVLSPTGGAMALAAVAAAGLCVAFRWCLQESAWVFVVGAMVTATALAVVRPPGEAATAVVLGLGLASVWLATARGWESLKWLTAVTADLGVLRLTAMATAPSGLPHGVEAVHAPFVAGLLTVLMLGYVGSSVTRALRGRHPIRAFDFLQSVAVWAIAWGGAVRLARSHDVGTGGLALLALIAGGALYVGAFRVVDRHQGRNRAFFYLSTLALALVLLGLPGVAGGGTAALWALLAVVAAAVGSRWDRVTLRVHAVAMLVAAWTAGGLAVVVSGQLAGRVDTAAVADGGAMIVAALTVVTTLVVLFGRRLQDPGWEQRLPLTALFVMSGLVFAAAVISLAVAVVPAASPGIGTVALAIVTIGFAVLASRWGVVEAGWVVYPLLAVTGLRVIFTDLTSGRTVVFVVALAAYGAALILSPRLSRSRRTQTQP